MEIKREKKVLSPPAVGMRSGLNLPDPGLQAIVQSMQTNICALESRLVAAEEKVAELEATVEEESKVAKYEDETTSTEQEVKPPVDPGWYGRVRVSESGHVQEGTSEFEVHTTFPAIPEDEFRLIYIDGQAWGAGPDDTCWYPLQKFTTTEGVPGTTP